MQDDIQEKSATKEFVSIVSRGETDYFQKQGEVVHIFSGGSEPLIMLY
jgi:hypothetical protein